MRDKPTLRGHRRWTSGVLFDHLVSAADKRMREGNAERPIKTAYLVLLSSRYRRTM